jgi:hypothetical protein
MSSQRTVDLTTSLFPDTISKSCQNIPKRFIAGVQ